MGDLLGALIAFLVFLLVAPIVILVLLVAFGFAAVGVVIGLAFAVLGLAIELLVHAAPLLLIAGLVYVIFFRPSRAKREVAQG